MTSQSSNHAAVQGKRPKILIVDDQERNLVALETLLSGLDAELIRAGSGNEALTRTLDHDFALVLLDVQMPEMDGFETAQLMREAQKTAHVPIIFISAIYSGEIYRIKGIEAGAIDFVEKPVVPAVLLGKVRLFLELHEHRLALQKETTRQIVEQVSDGVLLVDCDGTIKLANAAAEKLFGVGKAKLDGTLFDFPLQANQLQEISFTADDGRVCAVELNVSSMLWHGEAAYVVSMRDVTERQHVEKELKAIVKELNASNEELQSFTYTVSHDLKSPLITIGGYVGLIEEELGDTMTAEVRSYIGEVIGAAKQMTLLLDHLLALSRVGRMDKKFSRVALSTLAKDAINLLGGRLASNHIEIRVADDLPSVSGDGLRLQQMLQNLIENAVRYMGDQPNPLIEVGVAETPAGRALFVRDNGSGVEPRFHNKIFDLFERLDLSTEGSGVGLTLVKKIASLHNGEAWVESEGKGMGATFWVRLPFED